MLARLQRELLDQWRGELAGGATRIGWKIGHAIPEVQAVVGDQPVIGYLTSRTLLMDGGEWIRQGHDVRAETELAIELCEELGAGAARSETAAAIAGLGIALEIVDVGRACGDIDAVMRGNVFHRAVVLGPTREVQRRELGRASLRLGDAIHEPIEPLPEPVSAVRAVAELLAQFGESLLAGDRVLSGSVVHEPLGHATRVTAAVEGLGEVSVAIRHAE